jgi:hypothetical protein
VWVIKMPAASRIKIFGLMPKRLARRTSIGVCLTEPMRLIACSVIAETNSF